MSSFPDNNADTTDLLSTTTPNTVEMITSRDLDVEDAEGQLLDAVEDRHRHGSTVSLLAGSSAEVASSLHPPQQQQQQQQQQPRFFRTMSSLSNENNNNNNNNNNTQQPRAHSDRNVSNHPLLPGAPVSQHSQRTSASDPTAAAPRTSGRESFRAAAQRVQRMNQLKRIALLSKQRQAASARNLLQDIQEESSDDGNSSSSHHHHGGSGGRPFRGDGLIKHNPYAESYDHHLLKADSSSSDEEEHTSMMNDNSVDGRPLLADPTHNNYHHHHPPALGLHHRTQSLPAAVPAYGSAPLDSSTTTPSATHSFFRRTSSQSNHHQQQQQHVHMIPPPPTAAALRQTSSDYIATNTDGYMDAVVHANPSFAHSANTGAHDNNNNNMNKNHNPNNNMPNRPGLVRHRRHHTDTNNNNIMSTKQPHLFPRWMRECGAMCHPYRVAYNCQDILEQSFFLWVGVPCLLTSMAFFYCLENYQVPFLPGDATVSWWLLLATRQTVTLGLARMTIYVVVDGFMLGTRLAVQTLGPLLTLTAATGKGWPLILAAWGMWNLILIHGYSPFQRNWLYWTRIAFFNQNYNGGMLNSSLYTRFLWATILCGLAVCAKRTILALRFGRKQYEVFKPRLERILADVVLLSDIAGLAETMNELVDDPDAEEAVISSSWDLIASQRKSQKGVNLKDFLWSPQPDTRINAGASVDGSVGSHGESSSTNHHRNTSNIPSGGGNSAEAAESIFDPNCTSSTIPPVKEGEYPKSNPMARMARQLPKTESGRLRIKDMLDPWKEPPDSKGDKSAEISIHEILKFRRALSHLDEENLFGEAFGCTANRDETIASSHAVYHRLLTLVPETEIGHGVLPFDVLALLTLEEDGVTENLTKKRMIRRIFTPDRSGGLPLLAFIQATDKIYKRLRYFRASIRNASVIDGVLERLLNGIFYFILSMLLTSLMQLNPWTLLASLTSLLVSVSFALGSSISKYVEGVLLIAVRRPYDLGDRIFISSAESLNPTPDVTSNSWFVEDITLTTTTLRAAKTNEVSTVNNWSISGSRIVNCARSANATVHFQFCSHISMMKGNKLNQFKAALHKYVEEHPRVWDSVSHIRHDRFDADQERIDFEVAIRHRSSWQESGRIKLDRSEIHRFVFELGNDLGVHFSAPVNQQVVYQGGTLKRGDHDNGYARDLMQGSNMMTMTPA